MEEYSKTLTKLPEDAKPTYVEGVYVTPSAIIYYYDSKKKLYKKASEHKYANSFTKKTVNIYDNLYMKHTLFAEAFVENPYKDLDTKSVAIAMDEDYSNLLPENFKWVTLSDRAKSEYELCPICKKRKMLKGRQCCSICKSNRIRASENRERKSEIARDKVRYITTYVTKFTEKQKEVLNYYYKGYNISEIGRKLGKSKQAIFNMIDNLEKKAKKIEVRNMEIEE